jgi:methionyl-tRNA formyltransferase
MKLIILGSGEVLLKVVKTLYSDKNVEIVAIGVDKSNSASAAALIEFSNQNHIKLIEKPEDISQFRFDFVYMLSYPVLISKELLQKHLFVNTHYAPLPKYRGFHGFVWSLINGEKKVGYTIHKTEEGIDNGAIYHQFLTDYADSDNVISVIERIDTNLLENIKTVLFSVCNGKAPIPQDEAGATYVCRRRPEDGLIDWKDTSNNVFNLIRALTPPYTPGAYTFFKGSKIVVKQAEKHIGPNYISTCGQVVAKLEKGVLVKCGDGVIMVKTIVVGGTEMPAKDYFKTVGAKLGPN